MASQIPLKAFDFAAGADIPAPCPSGSDNTFGPFSDCRFDFTLLFEQCILTSVPALCLIISAPVRIRALLSENGKTTPKPMRRIKIFLTIVFALLQTALLVSWALAASPKTTASIPSSVLNLVAATLIIPLSSLEHDRSISPSSILALYVLFSGLLDLAHARTLFLVTDRLTISTLFSVSLGLKVLLLIVESQGKRSYLKPVYKHLSPEVTSGVISRSTLWWLNDLFRTGSKRLLSSEDVYELDPALVADNVGEKMRRSWEQRTKPEGRFSLVFATWRALRVQFAYAILPRVVFTAFIFSQPFLLSRVLQVLGQPDNDWTRNEAYGLTAATALINVGIGLAAFKSIFSLFRLTTMFRGGMITLIYDRTLILQDGVYDESAAVSLMSNDVDQISVSLKELNEIWARVLEMMIGLPLLTRQLGWVSIVPIIVVIIPFYGAAVIARLIGGRQKLWGNATQRRLGITGAMLKDMGSLKMMGLNEVVGEKVQTERVAETKVMGSWAWLKVWQNTISNVPYVMAPAATFAVYAVQAYFQGSESLNTVQAFTSLTLITMVSFPTTRLLTAVPNAAACIGCFDRIQKFLLAESRSDERSLFSDQRSSVTNGAPKGNTKKSPAKPVISPEDPSSMMVCLENASIRPAPAAAIVLSDVNISVREGTTVMVTGPVGAGKTTLLKAILGELPCDSGTVWAKTKRMAYCSQSPWLQSGTIRDAICGAGNGKHVDEAWLETVLDSCALTYDLSQFPAGDQTLIGSRGVSLSGGQKHRVALARAIYSRYEIFILDDVLSALDKTTEKIIAEKLFGKSGLFRKLGSTVIMVTHSTRYLPLAHQVIVIPGQGQKIEQGEYRDIERAGLIEDLPAEDGSPEITSDDKDSELIIDTAISNKEQELARQTGDLTVYRYYLGHVGLLPIFLFVSFVILNAFCSNFSRVWLKWWTDVEGTHIALYISVYFLLGVGFCIGMGGYVWACMVLIGPSTGRKLHRVLLNTVMKAPLSFFAKTETGSILSRFSQDMTLIESQLATGLLVTVSNLFSCIAAAALVVTGSPLLLPTLPLLLIAVYFLQRTYLRTSRQLRYLDLESRSPLYSHFIETLEGLSTIRAFGWEEAFSRTAAQRLDDSQKPYYLLFCIQRWLQFVLDMITAGVATLVVGLGLGFRGYTEPGLLGVSMTSIFAFSISLSQFIAGYTLLETSLGAISRLRTFQNSTPIEALPSEVSEAPDDWPSHGAISIQNLTVHHTLGAPALDNINLTFTPGQKISICGRTGSGKSTLLSTLLRTLTPTTGTLIIDGIDLSTLSRPSIRRHLTTIPQTPLWLPGTLRANLDPFSSAPDSCLIAALQAVQLWETLEGRGGLDAEVHAEELSAGQGQLFSLARAIVNKKNVVLMDEATSSIDQETERIVREVVGREFEACTVLTVAHRRETILDGDVVVVLEGGKVVEIGEPEELMGKVRGKLRGLLGVGVEI